jgi:phosphohistidine phosphatase
VTSGPAPRTLHLLRHAKSSWDDPGLDDHDRPLASRGKRAAKKLAAHLEASGISPDVVLCSSARRTRETLKLIEPALGEAELRVEPGLYAASEGMLLEVVRGLPPQVRSALLIGHNPGLQAFALVMAGGGDEEARRRLREKMPTGALATLAFRAATWGEVEPRSGVLVDYVVPRELS